MKKWIDSHAHLSNSTVYEKADEMLQRAQQADLAAIVNICTDKESLEKGLELAKRYPWVYNTASTTPHDVEKEGDEFFPLVEEAVRQGGLVAIGETGLDYHYMHSPKDIQQVFFRRYLKLALESNLPVVIHCRDAFADLFQILDEEYPQDRKGVLHCFTGTIGEAERLVKRGWYISISGIVTFKSSEELRQVAKMVPINQLLVETDTPYLSPQGKRGTLNEPANVIETGTVIATVKNIPLDELAKATMENACRFFGIKS